MGGAVDGALVEHAALLLASFIPRFNRSEKDRVLFGKQRLQEKRTSLDPGIVEWRSGWVWCLGGCIHVSCSA